MSDTNPDPRMEEHEMRGCDPEDERFTAMPVWVHDIHQAWEKGERIVLNKPYEYHFLDPSPPRDDYDEPTKEHSDEHD